VVNKTSTLGVRRLAAALRIDQFTDRVADSTALIARVSSRGNFGCLRDGIKSGGQTAALPKFLSFRFLEIAKYRWRHIFD
jgi:hypothetical protein